MPLAEHPHCSTASEMLLEQHHCQADGSEASDGWTRGGSAWNSDDRVLGRDASHRLVALVSDLGCSSLAKSAVVYPLRVQRVGLQFHFSEAHPLS